MTIPSVGNGGAALGPSIGSGAVTCTFGASTHAANDLLLVLVGSSNDVTATFSAPSGWTAVPNSPSAIAGSGSTGIRLHGFYRLAPDSASISCGSFDGGALNFLFGLVVTNVDTGNIFDSTTFGSQGTASASMSLSGPTTSNNDCLIVYGYATKYDIGVAGVAFSAQANANLSSVTENGDNAQPTGTGMAVGWTTGGLASAGSTGTLTLTQAGSAIYVWMTLAVRGVISGGGTIQAGRISLLGVGR